MTEAVKKEEPKKKGILGKLKEAAEDKEEPAAFNIPEQKLDPTFIASVFTGTLATFGVQAAGKKKNGENGGGASISKKDMEFLIAKASETAPAQTIRIESAPVKIVPDK